MYKDPTDPIARSVASGGVCDPPCVALLGKTGCEHEESVCSVRVAPLGRLLGLNAFTTESVVLLGTNATVKDDT